MTTTEENQPTTTMTKTAIETSSQRQLAAVSGHTQNSNDGAPPKSLRKMVKNARWLMEKRDDKGKRPDKKKPPQRRNSEDDVVVPPPPGGLAAPVVGSIKSTTTSPTTTAATNALATTIATNTIIVGADYGRHHHGHDSFSSVTLSDISGISGGGSSRGGNGSCSTFSLQKKKSKAARALAPVRPPDLPTMPLPLEEHSVSFVWDGNNQDSCEDFDHHHDSCCSNLSDLSNSHDWGHGMIQHHAISSHSASSLSITATGPHG